MTPHNEDPWNRWGKNEGIKWFKNWKLMSVGKPHVGGLMGYTSVRDSVDELISAKNVGNEMPKKCPQVIDYWFLNIFFWAVIWIWINMKYMHKVWVLLLVCLHSIIPVKSQKQGFPILPSLFLAKIIQNHKIWVFTLFMKSIIRFVTLSAGPAFPESRKPKLDKTVSPDIESWW